MENAQGSQCPKGVMADNTPNTVDKVHENEDSGVQKRGQWGSKLQFILTCVGYAVGLGNVWRFPYLCYRNGGGAFLIPYFTMLALVGIPIFYLELAFGQFASRGPISIWKVNPLLKGLGYAMVVINTIIGMYYCVIISYVIFYFVASCDSKLPWENCDNWWNTHLCFTAEEYRARNITVATNVTICHPAPGNETWCEVYQKEELKTPSEEYFYNNVLRLSDGIEELGTVRWELTLCLLGAWIIVFLVLSNGISSLRRVVYVTSTFPYIMLIVMLVRGCSLPGAGTGIAYYLIPDWSKLLEAKVWSDAATQIFFSLSACMGGLIAMSSFNKFDNNVYRDSILVPCINCGTSFGAGFVIFSVLGFMAQEKGVSVADVVANGPGLVFVVYPEALAQMPRAPAWAILFFLMLLSLGFSSEFSMIECFISSISDEFPSVLRASRKANVTFRALSILCFFLLTLPMVTEGGFYLFNLVDAYIGGLPLLVIGLFECIGLSYIYGHARFAEDIEMMTGKKPTKYFTLMWLVVTPVLLLFVTVFMCLQWEPLLLGSYVYPTWANGMGWTLSLTALAWIPGWFIFAYCKRGGLKLLMEESKPLPSWGPSSVEDRTGRYAAQDEVKKVEPVEAVLFKNVTSRQPSQAVEPDADTTAVEIAWRPPEQTSHDNPAFVSDHAAECDLQGISTSHL